MAKKNQVERDIHDMGVPMLGSGADQYNREPQGPEDALGFGPKRGDYTKRIGAEGTPEGDPSTFVSVPNRDDDVARDFDSVRVDQRALAEEIGDEAGLKGGVDTHDDVAAAESQASKKSSGSGSGSSSS